MQDRCLKCRKPREWKAQRDRAGLPFFRRLSRRGQEHFCQHVLPLRISVFFPPSGILLLTLLLALPAVAQPPVLFGPVSAVSDGDTLKVGKVRVRLHGIDAPETAQTCRDATPNFAAGLLPHAAREYRCGVEATNALRALVGKRAVFCAVLDVDRYGRLIGRCLLGSFHGPDISRLLVAQGWAVAYRKYSTDYVPDETRARAARLGIWRGSFQLPEDFRKENKR